MAGVEDLIDHESSWVEVGVAQESSHASVTPGDGAGARHVEVMLVPSGRIVDARVAQVGQGAGKGLFLPIAAGDEVLVVFAAGNPNRAIVVAGLGNARSPNPAENDGAHALLMHPGGVELRAATETPAKAIVHAQLLTDLDAWVGALHNYLVAVSAALTTAGSPVPPLDEAAWSAARSAFASAVTASAQANDGNGGPPHATNLHKVSVP